MYIFFYMLRAHNIYLLPARLQYFILNVVNQFNITFWKLYHSEKMFKYQIRMWSSKNFRFFYIPFNKPWQQMFNFHIRYKIRPLFVYDFFRFDFIARAGALHQTWILYICCFSCNHLFFALPACFFRFCKTWTCARAVCLF